MTDHEMILKIYDHITVMNTEQGVQAVEIAKLTAQMEFLCRFFWILMTASVGAFITSLWLLLTKKK